MSLYSVSPSLKRSRIMLFLFSPVVVVQLLSHVWLFATHGLQHARLLCPSLSPRVFSNSRPLSRWYHLDISSSVCLSGRGPPALIPSIRIFSNESALHIRWPSIGASVSVLPVNIQSWFPLQLTGLISLLSKGLSRVFSNTTVQKHQFFSI